MSGIYLMEKIRARCEENGDCLLWPGAITTRGPVVTLEQRQIQLRRVVWEDDHQKPFPPDRVASIDCGHINCLAAEHIIARTRAQLVARTNRLHASAGRSAKIANGKRRGSKLTDEAAEDIRTSALLPQELADKHSITKAYVYMIRAGRFRRNYSSPFAGLLLGARA
jgi:hypothetical protein